MNVLEFIGKLTLSMVENIHFIYYTKKILFTKDYNMIKKMKKIKNLATVFCF